MSEKIYGFHSSDVACRCQDPFCSCKSNLERFDRLPLMLRALYELLDDYPEDVVITSMLRCHTHNRTVGGSANSGHLWGSATDLIPDGPVYTLALAAESQSFWNGILVYPDTNVLHLDIHPSDRVVRGYYMGGKPRFLPYGLRRGTCLVPLHGEDDAT